MRHFKNRKTLAIACAVPVFTLVAIGVTFAVNNDWTNFTSEFVPGDYDTLFTEVFEAPSNWKTCETIEKTVTATNKNDYPIAVRMKFEESWVAKDGTELPLVSEGSGLQMAIINLDNIDHWQKMGDYYVYDTDLDENQTSTSPIASVTLNCDANRSNSNDNPGPDAAYADATYTLKVIAQTTDASGAYMWRNATPLRDLILAKANDLGDYAINFTRGATVSDNISTANGNGVNKYTENGQDVYYYRGKITDNNVVWADNCWKIIRTTATGGIKMVYNGKASYTTVDGVPSKKCSATGTATAMYPNTANYNSSNYSPADVGYMYGVRVQPTRANVDTKAYYFSNTVTLGSDGFYQMDTNYNDTFTYGKWSAVRTEAAEKGYHYFCTTRGARCASDSLGYILNFSSTSYFIYLPMNGYENITALKEAMFKNETNSNAKRNIENWFVSAGLDRHEDDLEDAVFCNDRSIDSGTLSDINGPADAAASVVIKFGAANRNITQTNGNFTPSLDCANVNDAFTKDVANGNGKLAHKVGLMTLDELRLAGVTNRSDVYLYPSSSMNTYTMSPVQISVNNWSTSPATSYLSIINGGYNVANYSPSSAMYYRPVVSLKAGTNIVTGDGTKNNPYIVKSD